MKKYSPTRFKASDSIYDKALADYAVSFIEALSHTKGTWAGKPFELIDWQEQIIRDIFGTIKPNGYRQFNTAYVEIPKKMGKSELAAAVALLLTCGDNEERAEVYGCAADRNQASIVFNVAADMVRMCPALAKRVKILDSMKRLVYLPTGSTYQVLSADVGNKHGFNTHGVVFDELHTQPNRKLYDVMTKGSGDARMQPLYFLITTAGDNQNSICWEVHQKALDIIASWIDEEGAIPESDDSFGQVSIGAYKLGTMIKVSEELLNDSVFNLETYIAKEFARRIGNKEEDAFFTGDGSGKPTGILAATGGAQLGVTTASATAITIDEILDLFYSLKAPYRNKAVFVMNDATVKAIRKLKDGQGQYLWQPSLQAGTPDTILNRPLYTSAYVPAIAASAKTIAFGDFGYYWVADRQGRVFKRLNELYAATGQVGFVATQRVDGKLILPEAIKVLQQKA